ncbi:MAG: DUF4159 domain-containing protein [Nitrospirota bacterium]
MLRKISILFLGLTMLGIVSGNVTPVNAQTYNVGIISDYENSDPMMFYNLDTDLLKPTGWELVNPLAPAVPKTDPNYWTVNLSTTLVSDLQQYDVLFFSGHAAFTLTDDHRDKMEQFVSNGGKLWIYDCGYLDVYNFFLNFQFESYQAHELKDAVNNTHPLISCIYSLSDAEIDVLGHPEYGSWVYDFDGKVFETVVINQNSQTPDVICAQHGSGVVIVSADDYGCALDEYPDPLKATYKFAYNLIGGINELTIDILVNQVFA